jgi:glycosyltransferase involved in cell wall biosynthesis
VSRELSRWLHRPSRRLEQINPRGIGDTARDEGRWHDAEQAYRQHLDVTPDDAAIWVQYGHALKELGKLEESEQAYREALALEPDNADTFLQLGHILKIQDRVNDAAEAYTRSLELSPSKVAYEELANLIGKGRASSLIEEKTLEEDPELLYVDIDDLLGYLRAHKTVSGIQRVQLGFVQYLLAGQEMDYGKVAFVRSRNAGGDFWRLQPPTIAAIVDYVTGDTVIHERLVRLLDQAEEQAIHLRPVAGQCYFVLGAFWGFHGDTTRFARLKASGVITGVYTYDLIPLTHPEYCDQHLTNDFRLSLGDGLAAFEFVLTISEFTAREIKRFQEHHDLRRVPIEAVPLSHMLHGKKQRGPALWSDALAPLQHRPFVLSVSTIEARKNHSYLLSIWKLFIEEGLDPPDLVFVGRYGWRVADLMEQLRATNFMDGRVHVLHDLSDGQLEQLYDACLFTAFPSFVEGWGLPVGESLAHGRPCVASNTSSIPEVGGDLVDYVDPYNLRHGIEVFRRMAFDATYRAQREEDIRKKFVPRTWQDVGSELLAKIARLRTVEVDTRSAPLLLPGEIFRPAELRLGQAVPANYPRRPLRVIIAEGWQFAEEFVAWMRDRKAMLRFQTELRPGTEIVVYLHLAGAVDAVDEIVQIYFGRREPERPARSPFPENASSQRDTIPIRPNRSFSANVLGRVQNDGLVEISLLVRSSAPQRPKDPGFYAGLISLSYAPRTDRGLRADILENIASERDTYLYHRGGDGGRLISKSESRSTAQ